MGFLEACKSAIGQLNQFTEFKDGLEKSVAVQTQLSALKEAASSLIAKAETIADEATKEALVAFLTRVADGEALVTQDTLFQAQKGLELAKQSPNTDVLNQLQQLFTQFMTKEAAAPVEATQAAAVAPKVTTQTVLKK